MIARQTPSLGLRPAPLSYRDERRLRVAELARTGRPVAPPSQQGLLRELFDACKAALNGLVSLFRSIPINPLPSDRHSLAYDQLSKALSSQQPTTLGPHPVGTAYATLQDPVRPDRGNLPVKVQYPGGVGPFPTLLISHGLGGSMEAFTNLGNFLASQGYLVIHPTHHDREAGQELAKQGYTKEQIARMLLDSPVERRHRPQDLSFLIDALENGSLARQIPGLQGKADLSKLGVLGHSFGGYTAMAVAGATVDLPNAPDTSFKDHRIKAAIALDPARFQTGLDDGAASAIVIPALVMYSTKLEERGGYFDEMPAGDKFDVVLNGAAHEDYGDQGETRFQAATMATSLAMLDAYLKGDAGSRAWLQAGGLSLRDRQLVTPERK